MSEPFRTTPPPQYHHSQPQPIVGVAVPSPRAMGAQVGGVGLAVGVPVNRPQRDWARPWFPSIPENRLRYPRRYFCGLCGSQPRHYITPPEFFEGGEGWQTQFFTDLVPFDVVERRAGAHQCVVPRPDGQPCGYVVREETSCSNECSGRILGCWGMRGNAVKEMKRHVVEDHGIPRPPRKLWKTHICDVDGCCEVCFCFPCQASRQMRAATGKMNSCAPGWCLFFTFGGPHCGCWRSASTATCIALPVCCSPLFVAPYLTRLHTVALSDIDEPECVTCLVAGFFPCCSLAQSYRQMYFDGADPGQDCYCDENWYWYDNSPYRVGYRQRWHRGSRCQGDCCRCNYDACCAQCCFRCNRTCDPQCCAGCGAGCDASCDRCAASGSDCCRSAVKCCEFGSCCNGDCSRDCCPKCSCELCCSDCGCLKCNSCGGCGSCGSCGDCGGCGNCGSCGSCGSC